MEFERRSTWVRQRIQSGSPDVPLGTLQRIWKGGDSKMRRRAR
jgi:hypothetical protein